MCIRDSCGPLVAALIALARIAWPPRAPVAAPPRGSCRLGMRGWGLGYSLYVAEPGGRCRPPLHYGPLC
eukprot:5123408-Alexandrium_andersonii.AAC.1